jgi:hypothetical protein
LSKAAVPAAVAFFLWHTFARLVAFSMLKVDTVAEVSGKQKTAHTPLAGQHLLVQPVIAVHTAIAHVHGLGWMPAVHSCEVLLVYSAALCAAKVNAAVLIGEVVDLPAWYCSAHHRH